MGEIKSTLDLVMERTRHLSMSAEEKAQQQKADFAKRLHGLLQQYADGAMTIDRLRDQINALQAPLNIDDPGPVLKSVVERIDPEKDNQPWLALLTDIAPAICQPLVKTIEDFQKEKAVLWLNRMENIRHSMAKQHDIKGSAVVPNPAADAVFLEQLARLRQNTQTRIDDLARQNG